MRAIEDVRGDLIRSRHRLGMFLLRRGDRYPGPGGTWTLKHLAWLRALRLDEPCSQATLRRLPHAVELLIGRRTSLIARSSSDPRVQSRPDDRQAALLPGIDTLSAASLSTEVGSFSASPNRRCCRGPRDRPVRAHLRHQAPPRLDHQGRAHARPPAVGRGGPSLPLLAQRRPDACAPAKPARTPGSSRSPGAPNDACTSAGSPCAAERRKPTGVVAIAVARELTGFLLGGRHA